ncbi:MAG: citrate transporter, partial [Paludibacteraceae bacterium]|nr:citrate transporter [Paludibacteraceae bacterium]
MGFGLDAWITSVTVLAMFSVLLFTRIRSDVVFLSAVGILYVTGVLDAKETLSGISQTSVAVVGVLFVVIAGLMHTGVLQWIVKHLLGTPKNYWKSVLRLM